MEPAFEVLAKASFLWFVSPRSTHVGNVPRVSVQLEWKSKGKCWGGESDSEASYPGIFPLQTPSADPQGRVTIQGCKLFWANRTGSAHPIAGVCVFSWGSAFVNSSSVLSKNVKSLTMFLFPPHPVCQGIQGCVVYNFVPTPLYLVVLGPSFWALSQDCWPLPFWIY